MPPVIPQMIHYCWFGHKPLPNRFLQYLDSWHTAMPNRPIKEWNEANTPHAPYIINALHAKNWSKAANYARFYALQQYGCIYLAVDVQLVRNLTPLLAEDFIAAFETEEHVGTAVIASKPHHPLTDECLTELTESFSGTEQVPSSVIVLTAVMKRHGLLPDHGSPQRLADATILPKRFFYPYSFTEHFKAECVSTETYAIHHWAMTWQSSQQCIRMGLRRSFLLVFLFRQLRRILTAILGLLNHRKKKGAHKKTN
ncbi:MAG: glycosyltransferase [Candidatus Peribacteraceae bacterium]|nr:glycosyltransferase [Candidatus Peribacteraceae bacterium]